jgi:thioesterase domain-containing protein
MVPDRLVPCEELPLNANGKVDYKALAQRLSAEVVAFDAKIVRDQPRTPTEPVEETLMALWEQILGQRPSNPNANFFEVGGQSLKAVRLVSEMRHHFGRHLPVSLVFREPTVAGMARYLRGEVDDPSSVIPINDQGERPPLFAGGSSREYRDLSRALPNQPFFQLDVYSLQERRALAGEPAYTTVQDIAAHFLADIQLIQPTGPYYLSGQCDGGIVILELALQLQRQGQEVALLAQFDTPATGNFRKLPAPQRLSWLLRNGQLPSRILERLSNGLWQDPATPQDRQHREIWEQIWAAVEAYEPSRPFDGEIQLFRAMETYGVFEDVSVGWEHRATRGVRIHDVPGNHYQFFQNADAQEIVAAVIERVDRQSDRFLQRAASMA